MLLAVSCKPHRVVAFIKHISNLYIYLSSSLAIIGEVTEKLALGTLYLA